MKYNKVLGSSIDQNSLAMTWRGVLVGIVPFLIIVLKQFDIELDSNEVVGLIDSVLAFVSTGMVVFGLVRKFVVKLTK